jgi:hypothetical protein
MAFFSKTSVVIKLWQKLAIVYLKTVVISPNVLAKIFLKSHQSPVLGRIFFFKVQR